MMRLITRVDEELPPYTTDTRKRDEALQVLWKSENLLSGVVSSAVSRDKNRGWTLRGTARQVAFYSKRLHGVHDNKGWRQFISMNATEWYTTNFGYISEIGFRSRNGNAETMWNMDATRCRLSSDPKNPVHYYPKSGAKMKLPDWTYIHGNSMPSFEEKFNYAGFCALERCLLFTRLMIGIFQHQLEKIGVAPPKGFLHMSGVTRNEWMQSVAQFREDRLNQDSAFYENVMGIFTRDPNSKINLIGLSQLPDNFTLKDFVDVLMQGYALAFGFPVGEFWSIETGSFGRTGEMNIQQEQAYAKGELDFALSLQEQLQSHFLPPSLSFTFDQRNDKGEFLQSEIKRENAKIIRELYMAGFQFQQLASEDSEDEEEVTEEKVEEVVRAVMQNIPKVNEQSQSLITREEARNLLVDAGIIPASWLEGGDQTDEAITDLQESRDAVKADIELRKMALKYPDEPIVRYVWSPEDDLLKRSRNTKTDFTKLLSYDWQPGEIDVLYESGEQMMKKRIY